VRGGEIVFTGGLTNNPLAFISSNLGTMGKYLERLEGFLELQSTRLAELAPQSVQEEIAAAFRRTGLEVTPLACDFAGAPSPNGKWSVRLLPSVENAARFKLWLTEEVGFLYYRVRGWA